MQIPVKVLMEGECGMIKGMHSFANPHAKLQSRWILIAFNLYVLV